MNIGERIKKYRENNNISQDELALKIFVSRQTISNWENNKSCPDIKSLSMLSNIFNVSLDDFIKGNIDEMKNKIEKGDVKKFNILGFVFFMELLTIVISAYPLFKFMNNTGIIIWVSLFLITLITSYVIEKFKKNNDIQTYKEIVAFMENKPLTYDQTQQEKGKRVYQKILYAIFSGLIGFIISLIVIFITNHI